MPSSGNISKDLGSELSALCSVSKFKKLKRGSLLKVILLMSANRESPDNSATRFINEWPQILWNRVLQTVFRMWSTWSNGSLKMMFWRWGEERVSWRRKHDLPNVSRKSEYYLFRIIKCAWNQSLDESDVKGRPARLRHGSKTAMSWSIMSGQRLCTSSATSEQAQIAKSKPK